MKTSTFLAVTILLAGRQLVADPMPDAARVPLPPNPALAFREIWAYVMADDPASARPDLPVTDLAWFAAGVSYRGALIGVPKPKGGMPGVRHHLVLAETGNADRMHFTLAPEFGLRDRLVADLAAAAVPFDGVQIDFESIELPDADNFRQFLVLLKSAIGDKCLSVALPARGRPASDAFDYRPLASLADRVVIMAYDEHWGGGPPGSIASPSWARRVVAHARSAFGVEKVVMGLPFYGRVWADKDPAGAYRYSSIERMRREQGVEVQRDVEGVPYFSWQSAIGFTAWYEDSGSVADKLRIYRDSGIERVGFWRLGLEDPAVWPLIDRFRAGGTGPEELAAMRRSMDQRYRLPAAR